MAAIVNRRRVMGSGLPFGAKQIAHLESTGTQWIDTGYVPKGNTELEIRYSVTKLPSSLSQGVIPYGCRVGYKNQQYNIYSPVNRQDQCHVCYSNSDFYFTKAVLNQTILVHANGPEVNFGGTTCTFNPGRLPNLNIYLFGMNNNGTFGSGVNLKLKIDYFWIKEDGQLILDMIPSRIDQVGYMYDKVSGRLFGNRGSDAFILGPDV